MLRLTKDNKYSLPVKGKCNEISFHPGMVVQKSGDEFKLSDGSDPFGIIDDIRTLTDDTTVGSGLTTVWPFKGEDAVKRFQTNQFVFDWSVDYKKDDPVYSVNGKLSLIPNGVKIGKVESLTKEYIEISVD